LFVPIVRISHVNMMKVTMST